MHRHFGLDSRTDDSHMDAAIKWVVGHAARTATVQIEQWHPRGKTRLAKLSGFSGPGKGYSRTMHDLP